MKTWFCKDTQQWVSEKPRAFWIGKNDYISGEKLYTDDDIYIKSYFGIKKYNGVRDSRNSKSNLGLYELYTWRNDYPCTKTKLK